MSVKPISIVFSSADGLTGWARCLSVCLSVSLSVCLSVSLSLCLKLFLLCYLKSDFHETWYGWLEANGLQSYGPGIENLHKLW